MVMKFGRGVEKGFTFFWGCSHSLRYVWGTRFCLRWRFFFYIFILCCASHGKVLTIDNLIRKRQMHANWWCICIMCKHYLKSTSHLLIPCEVVAEVVVVDLYLVRKGLDILYECEGLSLFLERC